MNREMAASQVAENKNTTDFKPAGNELVCPLKQNVNKNVRKYSRTHTAEPHRRIKPRIKRLFLQNWFKIHKKSPD